MGLRFLIVNTDYPEFLQWLYAQHPGLEGQSYEEQLRVRNESLFGLADFCSSNLRKSGHEAYDIHANNEFMQKAWARAHDIRVKGPAPAAKDALQQARRVASRTPLRHLKPLFRPMLHSLRAWFYEILSAQIKHFTPDILLNHAMHDIGTGFLKEMKSDVRLLVGQNAATPLPDSDDWGCYDLAISSFPPTIQWFRAKGIPAESHRLGFETEVLSYLKQEERTYDVTFVGGFHKLHSGRVALLNSLCNRFSEMRIWGTGVDRLPSASPIRRCYVGQAWGREMFQILHNSKITLNHHGDVGPYANNMRLFEATGVGTLLVTDWKMNLHEMFEPGKEVVTYRNPEECAKLIEYYLKHDEERASIARAGQQRTLREHTYYQRMQELVDLVNRYL
jgi:hypothetical protein